MLKKSSKTVQIFFGSLVASGLIAGCANMKTQESTGQFIDSTVLTTKVKAKLVTDNSVKSLPITVKTYKNTVQLSGFVDNYSQKRQAVAVAKSVEGVQEVEDALVVKAR